MFYSVRLDNAKTLLFVASNPNTHETSDQINTKDPTSNIHPIKSKVNEMKPRESFRRRKRNVEFTRAMERPWTRFMAHYGLYGPLERIAEEGRTEMIPRFQTPDHENDGGWGMSQAMLYWGSSALK